jgi:hypothetical protein
MPRPKRGGRGGDLFFRVWELLFRASFLSVQKATLGTAAAGPKTPSGLHSHGVWNWRAHSFGGQAAAFGAGFLQLPEA